MARAPWNRYWPTAEPRGVYNEAVEWWQHLTPAAPAAAAGPAPSQASQPAAQPTQPQDTFGAPEPGMPNWDPASMSIGGNSAFSTPGLWGPSDTGAGQDRSGIGPYGQMDLTGNPATALPGGGGGGAPKYTFAPSDKAATANTVTGGGASVLPGDARNAAQQKGANQQLLFQKLMQFLGLGGGPAMTPAAVPDFRADAMAQAELMRKRAGMRTAEEAAATGGAGSRDLAYRQSLGDEALFNAGGQIGAEQSGRQFTANLQAKALEAQQRQAEFKQVMAMMQALGAFTGGA